MALSFVSDMMPSLKSEQICMYVDSVFMRLMIVVSCETTQEGALHDRHAGLSIS